MYLCSQKKNRTMEGFILAAGLGTRLLPLTAQRPKALVEVGGKPLLQIAIERLEEAGVEHIVVNVHHFANMVEDFLAGHSWHSRIDISDERTLLLDTGGALKHAAPLFAPGNPVLVHNVDILSSIDLRALAAHHLDQHNLVTLCVSQRSTRRLLTFCDGLLTGRADPTSPPPPSTEALAFSGISVVAPDLFPLLPPADHPYPVIDQYIALAPNHRIGIYRHPADHWLDVGKPETLNQAQQWIHSSHR